MTFEFDGVRLIDTLDEEADILYLWTEPGPRPAVTFEDPDGHLIQLDPETREFVGVMIVDYKLRWEQCEQIVLHVPRIEQHIDERVVALVG